MPTLTRLAAAAAAALALTGAAIAQTPAQVPGNDGSPPTLSTHRPGETKPADTVEEVTSATGGPAMTNSSGTGVYVERSGEVVLRRVTPENTPAVRSDVQHETAALNRADTLPRGELSLAPRAGAPEGGFLRKF